MMLTVPQDVRRGADDAADAYGVPDCASEDFAAGQLDLETLKNAGRAVFDVTAYPLFQEALAGVPATERHGPLVTNENGRPVGAEALKSSAEPRLQLRRAKEAVDSLMRLCREGEPKCATILENIAASELFVIPDSLRPVTRAETKTWHRSSIRRRSRCRSVA
jgi:hypothetical protein